MEKFSEYNSSWGGVNVCTQITCQSIRWLSRRFTLNHNCQLTGGAGGSPVRLHLRYFSLMMDWQADTSTSRQPWLKTQHFTEATTSQINLLHLLRIQHCPIFLHQHVSMFQKTNHLITLAHPVFCPRTTIYVCMTLLLSLHNLRQTS